eukprot:365459-Chlamydomonas_euryale.AAC.6
MIETSHCESYAASLTRDRFAMRAVLSVVGERVIVDGNLTTSRGPGTAFEWALSLVKQLYGQEKMEAVAGPMVMYPYKV